MKDSKEIIIKRDMKGPKYKQIATNRQEKHTLKTQQSDLKSLINRNRSLISLFGDTPIIREHFKAGKQQQNIQKRNIFKFVNVQVGQGASFQNKNKHTQLVKDEYLIVQKDKKANKSNKNEDLGKSNDERRDYKFIKKDKPRQILGREINQNRKQNSKSYDPQSYNWRKSLSKQKTNILLKNNLRQSKESKASNSQYYGQNQVTGSNKMLNTKQNIMQRQNEKLTTKRRSSSGHCRNRSLSSKPLVARNVFEPYTPKSKGDSSSPVKSLLFTFGV